MMMSKFPEAIADAHMAIQYDSNLEKAYYRLVNCLILTGDYSLGLYFIEQVLDLYPSSSVLLKQAQKCKELASLAKLIGVCYANKEYTNVLIYLNKALQIASGSEFYKTMKAECEGQLKNDNCNVPNKNNPYSNQNNNNVPSSKPQHIPINHRNGPKVNMQNNKNGPDM